MTIYFILNFFSNCIFNMVAAKIQRGNLASIIIGLHPLPDALPTPGRNNEMKFCLLLFNKTFSFSITCILFPFTPAKKQFLSYLNYLNQNFIVLLKLTLFSLLHSLCEVNHILNCVRYFKVNMYASECT